MWVGHTTTSVTASKYLMILSIHPSRQCWHDYYYQVIGIGSCRLPNHNLSEEKGEPKRNWAEAQPNALPLGQTWLTKQEIISVAQAL